MPAQSPDHLSTASTRDESPDNIDTLNKQRLARAQNEIGAKVLTLVGFESRQKDIVESSFDKARKNKEKLQVRIMNVVTSPTSPDLIP